MKALNLHETNTKNKMSGISEPVVMWKACASYTEKLLDKLGITKLSITSGMIKHLTIFQRKASDASPSWY